MKPLPLNVSDTPPEDWNTLCLTFGYIFYHPEWHTVLNVGFAARTVYVRQIKSKTYFSISIFKVGPFRIGYLGFPVGGALAGELNESLLLSLKNSGLTLDILRVSVSAFSKPLELTANCFSSPETAVVDLEKWSLKFCPKLRRGLKKAHKNNVIFHDLMSDKYASELYEMYRLTVLTHGGQVKYTREYFSALLNLAQRSDRVRCIGGFFGNEMCGFVVAVLDAKTGYYLHGATDKGGKGLGISDLLIHEAIQWAQKEGMTGFNLMSSPVTQPGLVRYKEKFGAVTRQHKTYELTLSPLRAGVFKLALWMYYKIKGTFHLR
ncbi:MAG: GNAT family N-acetyltransferase [Gammaproteobacteria bacterium]